MPIDPDAVALLKELESTPVPQAEPPELATYRAGVEQLSENYGIRNGREGPDGAGTFHGDFGDVEYRVYQPRQGLGSATLVYLHGGGWVAGSITALERSARTFADASGCTVVTPEYALSPEEKFPLAVCQMLNLLEGMQQGEGLDSVSSASRLLGLGGESAGANIAAGVALMARDRGSVDLATQILIYPPTQPDTQGSDSYKQFAEGFFLTSARMKWFWECYLGGESADPSPYAAPLHALDLSGLPDTVIAVGEYDVLRDDSRGYAQRLIDAGVTVNYQEYAGLLHGFATFGGAVPAGHNALVRVARTAGMILSLQP